MHPPRPAAAEGGVRDCLIVDDDHFARGVLARQIGAMGVSVREADEAETALDIWHEWQPGAVFIDCVLPGCDGYALARTIRTIERRRWPVASTLLVGLSGHVDRQHLQRCEVAGMNHVLTKPASQRVFAELLRLPPLAHTSPSALASLPDARAQELRCLYASACHADLAALAQAQIAGQVPRIRFLAHRIEGASRIADAGAVGDAAGDVLAAADGPPSQLQASCDRLMRVFSEWNSAHLHSIRRPS